WVVCPNSTMAGGANETEDKERRMVTLYGGNV
ncbi:actin-1, partial [Nannochloropsis oceanica]